MQEVDTRPCFVIEAVEPLEPQPDALLPEDIVWIAEELERGIRDNPTRFQRVLIKLGEVVTSGNIQAFLDTSLDSDDDEGAAVLLLTYFSGRCDSGVEFDDDTERALAKDQDYQKAKEAHKNAQPKRVSTGTGTQSHRDIPNPNSGPARDTMRRLSLAFFIDREVAWQAQQESGMRTT